ncbi:MAG: Rrf2 family transcriptional regulator, partial [Treponema sp.]|nr:Rrf2 family transcriptional regulator [Treponema sp.]
ITLLDIYKAINEGEEEREVFNFHPNPNNKCPVGKNIHKVLDPVLADAQKAMEKEMKKTCLADLIKGIEG